MSRALTLLLTIAFLGTQLFLFAHTAEYGSWEHEHEGANCEICLSVKHQNCTSPGAASGTCFLRHTEYIPQAPTDVIIVRDDYDAGITRGPPISS